MRLYRFDFSAMGSPCQLQLYTENFNRAKRVRKLVISDVKRLEHCYSRYREDSVTAEINRVAAKGGSIKVDTETAALLDYAQTCFQQSDGLFDITSGVLRQAWDFRTEQLPAKADIVRLLSRVGWNKLRWERPLLEFTEPEMELDFGGIGKEYAADRAATLCMDQSLEHGMIDLGGDIRIIGPHPDGAPWVIGIRHPRQSDGVMASIELTHGGVASSGDYERFIEVAGKRYCHILNPKTGWPVSGLRSVSVVTGQCLVSGSACTIAMLKGQSGARWLDQSSFQSIWMDSDGMIGGSLARKRG